MTRVLTRRFLYCVLASCAAVFATQSRADEPKAARALQSASDFDSGPLEASHSPPRPCVERFEADLRSSMRFEGVDMSPCYRERLTQFRDEWLNRLNEREFDSLERDEQVDYVLVRLHLKRGLRDLSRDAERFSEMAELLPFVDAI